MVFLVLTQLSTTALAVTLVVGVGAMSLLGLVVLSMTTDPGRGASGRRRGSDTFVPNAEWRRRDMQDRSTRRPNV